MLRLRRLVPALTVGALAAAPAAASARNDLELTATGPTVHGYAVKLDADQEHGRTTATLSLSRRRRGQTTSSVFTPRRVRFSGRQSHRRGRVRFSLGTRGRVALTFRATGRSRRTGADSCTFDALHGRRGVLTGTARLRAGGRFHTVRFTRMRALLADHDAGDCSPRNTGSFTSMTATTSPLDVIFDERNNGRLYVTATGPATHGRGWRHEDVATAAVSQNGLIIDLGTGRGKGTVHGPFLNGTLEVTSDQIPIPTGEHGDFSVDGTVGGTFVAHLPDLGARRPAAGGPGHMTFSCEDECSGL